MVGQPLNGLIGIALPHTFARTVKDFELLPWEGNGMRAVAGVRVSGAAAEAQGVEAGEGEQDPQLAPWYYGKSRVYFADYL